MDPFTAAALTTAVTATVSLLVENLSHLISYNWKLFTGLKKSCEDLLNEVKRLNAFLVDNVNWRSDSEQWKVLVDTIRCTVYKAENVVDKLLIQAKIDQESNIAKKLIQKYTNMNFTEEINGILEEARKIVKSNQRWFEANPTIDHQAETVVQEEQGSSLENHEVVGFDEEAAKVIIRLVEGAKCLDVIPVVGMVGLGKTTLARKIYNDPKISHEFSSYIWVFIGQSWVKRDILFNILNGFTNSFDEFKNSNEADITKEIHKRVANKGKCLIVLDDVWDPKVIDFVKTVFPVDEIAHRIMMTTRNENVARSVNQVPHILKFLDQTESYQLLAKRALGNSSVPVQLEDHGKAIVTKCSGVPLIIVVIAGALRGRTSEIDWKVVKENVGKHCIEEKLEKCRNAVELSYKHLPQEKKACFLYLGAFPEGFDIPAWKLIRLWIAEGLIMSKFSGIEIEDIAEYYLNDFANRNLVMVTGKRSNGRIKTFCVHDMLREFCVEEATRLTLFKQVRLTSDQDIPNLTTCRRVSIQSYVPKNFISEETVEENVRSLLCFSSKQKQVDFSNINVQLIPNAFPLMRVLDIESLKFSIPKEFYQLLNLRYIAISSDFKELPEVFTSFWYVQTLILNTSHTTFDVKADIWNMPRLRHLCTNKPANLPLPTASSTSGTSTNSCLLQTLSLVTPESCKSNVLSMAGNLKKMSVEGNLTPYLDETSNAEFFSNFHVLNLLESLTLLNDDKSNKSLHLPSEFSKCLPNLKKLTLSKTRFDWNQANILGEVENLQVLNLKENAFTGESWKMKPGGFEKLQVLWIKMADFKSWDASDCLFPRLRSLVLISCLNLEAVPLELAGLDNLQEMTLDNTSKASKSARESGKFKLTLFPTEADFNATE